MGSVEGVGVVVGEGRGWVGREGVGAMEFGS